MILFTEQEKVRGQVRLTVLSILLDCYFVLLKSATAFLRSCGKVNHTTETDI